MDNAESVSSTIAIRVWWNAATICTLSKYLTHTFHIVNWNIGKTLLYYRAIAKFEKQSTDTQKHT